ncbi:MAG: T9SS type A sorting domain-containing protein [Bacteroidales bacterium]|nr:T9SS type A sorting domain-containing protein [Bacteroidales bacterium]
MFKKYFSGLVIILLVMYPVYGQPGNKASEAVKYLEERGEVDFKIISYDSQLINKLSEILSVVNVNGNVVTCNANADEFVKFLALGKEYVVIHPAGYYYKPGDNKGAVEDWQTYPTYEEYDSLMHVFVTNYPDICKIDTIGYSVEDRLLLGIKISDNVSELENEPEVFLTSTMHGNETGGYILMLRLIDYLLENYSSQTRVTSLIDSLQIWINPLANPDGTYTDDNQTISGATRRNANSVDLNRNFPDPQDGPHPDGHEYQPETTSMMDFMTKHNFVISVNFHSGSEVVNYPWDTWSRLHADDLWFKFISREYADTVHQYSSGYMTGFSDGITNGYAWYSINGGRQDYVTYFLHGREVTIELDYSFITPVNDLDNLWNYNYRSFLNYISQALYGIHGEVTDFVTGQPLKAEIRIDEHDLDSSQVFSDSLSGKFVRLINEGKYNLWITSDGYQEKRIDSVSVENYQTTHISIQLVPIGYGISEKLIDEQQMMNLYPDPVYGILHTEIKPEKSGLFTIEIISVDGKTLKTIDEINIPYGGTVVNTDVSELSGGIYFIRLRNNNKVWVRKFIKSE